VLYYADVTTILMISNTGTNCLFSTCPGYNCKEVLGEEVYEYLCDDDLVNKYRQFLLNSFVDESENMKWYTTTYCIYLPFIHSSTYINVYDTGVQLQDVRKW
jgi:hypothetical protein